MQGIHRADITGLILAGGASRRMQEYANDKGLLTVNNKPLVQHVLERLTPQVGQVVINANRHLDQYQHFGVPVWSDLREEDWETFPGPLAGFYTGLKKSQTPWLATAPCDSPLLPENLIEQMAAMATETKIVIAATEENDKLKEHPVFALLHQSLAASLYDYISQGQRKILPWMQQHHYQTFIVTGSPSLLLNVNTGDDLQQLIEITKSKESS